MNNLGNENILLGSGELYAVAWSSATSSQKSDPSTIVGEGNRVGDIRGGATLSYGATFTTVQDDLIRVKKTILSEENIVFKTGLITFDNDRLAMLISTGENDHTTAPTSSTPGLDTLKIGGLKNKADKEFLFYFKHTDKVHGAYWRGSFASGFDLSMVKDDGSQLDIEIQCNPFDPDNSSSPETHSFFYTEVVPATT